jgi:tetratricopeptide (TPR) repeat protein
MTDEHIGIALAMCDQLDGKHRWRVSEYEIDLLVSSLPSNQDRSLVAALLAFYYARLLPGVHVLLPDQERATQEAAIYRRIVRELGTQWQVGLIHPRENLAKRLAAPEAQITVGAVDEFHARNPATLPIDRLAIFRVASAPAHLQRIYRIVGRVADPIQLSIPFSDEEEEKLKRERAAYLYCPAVAKRRVEAIQQLLAVPSSLDVESEPGTDPMAAVELGVRRSDKGDLAGAAAAYQIAAKSGHPEAAPLGAFRLGLIRRRLGDRAGAEAALRFAFDTGHPDHAPMAAFSLGGLFDDDPHQAADAYQKAIATGHADAAPMAALCLAEIREDQGDLDAAAAAYQLAIDSNHADIAPKSAVSLGMLRQKQGDLDAAAAAFRLAADSQHPEAASLAHHRLSELARQSQATGFTLTFPDRKTGEQVSADPGLVEALLVKHDRVDLVGVRYFGAPTPDGGYEITFRE